MPDFRHSEAITEGPSGDLPNSIALDPMPLLIRWFEAARTAIGENFNAMVLATATPDGIPAARVVLCKNLELCPPAAVFYTNYNSRKGKELASNPRAAGVFYWRSLGRQARLEGSVVRTSAQESDGYFASRPFLSRIGAIASHQSEPLPSLATLAAQVLRATIRRPGVTPRPDHWGGFRILLDKVELWSAGAGRLHDRIAWVRDPAVNPRAWIPTRLYP